MFGYASKDNTYNSYRHLLCSNYVMVCHSETTRQTGAKSLIQSVFHWIYTLRPLQANNSWFRNGRQVPRRAQKTGPAGQRRLTSAAAGPKDGSSGPETAAKCASREDVPLTNMVRRILPPDKGFFYFSFKHKGSFYGPDASLHFLG